MKKLLSMMLATMMLLATSCIKDDIGLKHVEQNVRISVGIPQSGVQSRTAYTAPGLNQNMRVYMYLMYDGKIVSILADGVNHNFHDGNLNKDIRIVTGKDYKIAVWADFGGTYYTVTGTLNEEPKVKMASTTITGSNNMYDAYFAIEDLSIVENKTIQVTLERPFGLVKINTLDYKEPSIVDKFTPVYYSTTITNVPTSLNLLTGETGDTETVTIVSSENSNITDFKDSGELSFDYFFAGESQANLDDFTVKYSNSDNNEILSYEYKNIPVRRNYITNVSGNILTKNGDLQITIEQNWEGNILENVDPAQLQDVINNAATSDAKDIVISVSEDIKSGDINNNTLSMPETDKNIVLEVPSISNVTISEETSKNFTGNLTLKLPETGTTASDVTINLPNSTVTVENGTYTNVTATTAENTLIVSEGTTIESLTVNGGNVKIYGNVNKITKGNDATNSKFTWFVNSTERLSTALSENVICDNLLLTSDIMDITDNDADNACIRITKEGLVFDGNGFTVSGNAGQNVMVVGANNVEIKNLTITQPTEGAASNGLTAYCVTGVKVTDVTIHNCRKAGMIVNGAEVTAKGLHTYGNAWGAVNVGKGSGVTEEPKFAFDATCKLEESNKVWVDCAEPWTVNAPEGWRSFVLNGITVFTNEPVEPVDVTVSNLDELKSALPGLAINGGKLTIDGDFEITDIPTLEINNPTTLVISGNITSEDENFYLLNKSELTIEATGTVDFNKRVVENHGKLSVTGGTYYSHTRGSGTIFWNNNENAEMVLNDVTTYATNFAVAGNGKIEINGGLITSDSSNKYGSGWAYCVRAQSSGNMIINDATIQGVQGAIACIESSKITLNNVKAIAKNSEPGRQDAFYALYPASDGVIEVNSGEFYSDRKPCCLSGDDDVDGNPFGAFILKGGKYSSMPKSQQANTDWPAEEGYKFIETGDETYPYEIIKSIEEEQQ